MRNRGKVGIAIGVVVVLALAVGLPKVYSHVTLNRSLDAARAKITWTHPLVPKYGGVYPRPNADMQIDPAGTYKVFADVVTAKHAEGQPYKSLQRLARLVNLMGYAKVPPENVHIVALLEKQARTGGLNNETYRRLYGTDNPNLKLLHDLKKAGVKLMVCSQAVAELGLQESDLDPSITVTLSGLSDTAIYGGQGYAFLEL
ncbi:MAG TPA: DsrE family protein [Rhodanobacteraceae bacterium]|nr:DsrE family protein [Rhodanobacteraceae bacterium]